MAIQTKIPHYDCALLEKYDGTNSQTPITFRGYTAESLLKAHSEVGQVFETEINGEPFVCFAGLDANEVAWRTPDDWSYHDAVGVFREELSSVHLTQLDQAPHRRKRRLLNKGFKHSSVMAGMPAMAREIAMGLRQLANKPDVEMHQALMQILTRSHAASSVKETFTDEEIARMVDFEEGFIGALFMKKHERELIYNRASYLDIKNAVLGRLHEIVKARLDGATKDDMLDAIIHQKVSGNLEGLSEEELIYDTYLLLIAGTGNTSKLLCYLMDALASNPEWRLRLREELKDFDASRLAGGMKEFPLLKATLMETERLFPAAPVLPRVPAADVDFLGYPIAQGTNCLHLVALMHFNEEIYEEPFKFLPERWLKHDYPKSAHGVFGGGTHTCLGMNVARIQMPIMIGYLLSQYKFEITKPPVIENYAYPGEVDSMTLRMEANLELQ